MKNNPLRPGDAIIFRDLSGIAHPGIFIGKNPAFARVKMTGTIAELIVPVSNLLQDEAAHGT